MCKAVFNAQAMAGVYPKLTFMLQCLTGFSSLSFSISKESRDQRLEQDISWDRRNSVPDIKEGRKEGKGKKGGLK